MKKHPLTLVEMLVVMMIVAILAGILLPAIGKAIKSGEETQTKSLIQQLAVAVRSYETTYNVFPCEITDSTKDSQLTSIQYTEMITLLTGDNARGIVFIEPTEASNPSAYNDAWGEEFGVAIDTNYDGRVDTSLITGSSGATSYVGSVFIWSGGSDFDQATTDDNVNSWR